MEKKEPIMDAAQEAVMDEKELQREQQAAMLDAFFRIHDFLVEHASMPIRR